MSVLPDLQTMFEHELTYLYAFQLPPDLSFPSSGMEEIGEAQCVATLAVGGGQCLVGTSTYFETFASSFPAYLAKINVYK